MKVRECDHNASTIVVLTKADKVDHQLTDPDELETQLFVPLLRGLGRPGLEWLHSMGGCVAVCNRKQDNTVSLIEQRKVEAALFQGMLARATGEFATDERKQQLSQNMGSKQLIMQMAAMYRRHIVTTWVPRAKQDAERLRDQIGTQMSNLGPHPDQMPITELLAAIQTKVNYRAICKAMVEVVSRVMETAPTYFVAGSSANLLEWAEATLDTKDKLAQVVHNVTVRASRVYERVACEAYDVVFSNNQQFKRFPALQEQVKMRNIPNRILEALTPAKAAIGVMVANAEQQLYNGSLSQQDVVQVFQQLKHSMGRCIVEHMVKFLRHNPLTLPPDFQLVEDEATAMHRRSLLEQKGRVNSALMQLQEMSLDLFLEHGTAPSQATAVFNPLQHLESFPPPAIEAPRPVVGGHPPAVGDTDAINSFDAELYADSPTAVDVQHREADPLPISTTREQSNPNHMADSTGAEVTVPSRTGLIQPGQGSTTNDYAPLSVALRQASSSSSAAVAHAETDFQDVPISPRVPVSPTVSDGYVNVQR
ncbi:hypothetical protein ABBQ38_008220 [Trebouxia sp. C0009 RCD-2024]